MTDQATAQVPFTPASEGQDATQTRVIEVDPQRDTRWEAFVASQPGGLIYHHPQWLRVLERAYGLRPISLACENAEGQLRGVLPLFHTRGLLTGRRLSSLPHSPVAGPLACDAQSAAALIRAAVKRVCSEPGARLQLKVPSTQINELVDGVVRIPWELTYVLELPERPAELHFGSSRNHARIKWAVSKAAKLGVQVRPAETEDELRAWYELYLDTMRWHAVLPRPYRFFKVCWEVLRSRGLMRLLLAEQRESGQSKLLAGSILLMFGQTVFYAFNGRRREDLPLRPNDVIQWRAIHEAHKDGFRYYDFGEVEQTQQGLADFKRKWGAKPAQLYRCYYPAPRELQLGILKSGSASHQLLTTIWRHQPLKVTAILGDWIYSYL